MYGLNLQFSVLFQSSIYSSNQFFKCISYGESDGYCSAWLPQQVMLNAINKSLSVTRSHSAIPLSPFASKQMSSAMQVLGSGPAPSISLLTNPCSFVNA